MYEDQDRFVRLEVTTRASRQKHNHPATVDQEHLTKLLTSMTVTPRVTAPQGPLDYAPTFTIPEGSPAFSAATADFLSIYIGQALTQATPLEEALFFLSATRSGNVHEITSGGFYVEDGRLHLLLANFHHPTVGQFEVQEARAAPLTVLGQAGYELDPGPFGKVKPPSGILALLGTAPQHLIIDYKARAQSRSAVNTENADLQNQPTMPESNTAEKLRELEYLRSEGLISAEEYKELREKLLDRF